MNSLVATSLEFSRSHTTLPHSVCLWSKYESLAVLLQALRLLFSRGGKRFNAALMLFHQSSFGKYSGDFLFFDGWTALEQTSGWNKSSTFHSVISLQLIRDRLLPFPVPRVLFGFYCTIKEQFFFFCKLFQICYLRRWKWALMWLRMPIRFNSISSEVIGAWLLCIINSKEALHLIYTWPAQSICMLSLRGFSFLYKQESDQGWKEIDLDFPFTWSFFHHVLQVSFLHLRYFIYLALYLE